MITDRIGRHKVLLPINHNFTKFVICKALFKIKTQDFFASNEKIKPCIKHARDGIYSPQ